MHAMKVGAKLDGGILNFLLQVPQELQVLLAVGPGGAGGVEHTDSPSTPGHLL